LSEKSKIEEKILIKAGEEFVKKNPFLSLGLSLGMGYVIGYWKGKEIIEQLSKIAFAIGSKELLKLLEENKEK
jgi:hypothetical protein